MYALRPMVPADAADVSGLIRAAFAAQSVPTHPPPSALRMSEADVRAGLRTGGGSVAEVAGKLDGTVLWSPQEDGLYVSRLAVATRYRGLGIAKSLLAAAEAAACRMALPRVHLSTRLVLLDNRRLFAACGFSETKQGTHPGYAEATFVNMEKRLA